MQSKVHHITNKIFCIIFYNDKISSRNTLILNKKRFAVFLNVNLASFALFLSAFQRNRSKCGVTNSEWPFFAVKPKLAYLF